MEYSLPLFNEGIDSWVKQLEFTDPAQTDGLYKYVFTADAAIY